MSEVKSKPAKEKTKEIVIEYDESCEMIKILQNKIVLVGGNYWDFDRSPKGFQDLFSKLGFNVTLVAKDMTDGFV